MQNLELNWDHRGVFLEGKPLLFSEYEIVKLDGSLTSCLDWEQAIEKARKAKWIIWEIDLGISHFKFPYEDQMQFESIKLALKHFSIKIYPEFSSNSLGVILYRGSSDFIFDHFWTDIREKEFLEFTKESEITDISYLKSLFAADIFVQYCQALFTSFVDELPVFILLNAFIEDSIAKRALLLCKERFEHFVLIANEGSRSICPYYLKEDKIIAREEKNIGICIPLEEMITDDLLDEIDVIIEQVGNRSRITFESHLTEDWESLDYILVFSSGIKPVGIRKLKGFIAAGGIPVVIGEPLGVEGEISLGKFLAI